MKKLTNIAAGTIAGLILIIFINPLIGSAFKDINSVILPLIINILFIEAAMIIIAKQARRDINISLMVFQVVITSFLLIYIVTAVINIVFGAKGGNDLSDFIKQSGYSYNKQLVIMLAASVVLFIYTNLLLNRMKKNLPTIIENKNGKNKNVKR